MIVQEVLPTFQQSDLEAFKKKVEDAGLSPTREKRVVGGEIMLII